MAGASLLPDLYKSKVNLALLLAPPASMYYNPEKMLSDLGTKRSLKILYKLASTLHLL